VGSGHRPYLLERSEAEILPPWRSDGRVTAGRAARLDEAAADVVYMLAVPFLGAGEAARLAAGAARRRHLRAVA
jgi:hypothetical protein